MNEVLTRDYRKKENLNWLNNNIFMAVYDQYDNNILSFENIESACQHFNITMMELLRKIRNCLKNNLENYFGIEYQGHKLKIYVFEKDKLMEEVRRR